MQLLRLLRVLEGEEGGGDLFCVEEGHAGGAVQERVRVGGGMEERHARIERDTGGHRGDVSSERERDGQRAGLMNEAWALFKSVCYAESGEQGMAGRGKFFEAGGLLFCSHAGDECA